MPKRFTLAEAQHLIPQVDRLLRDAVSLKGDFQTAHQALMSFAERITMMGGMVVDRDRVIDTKTRRDALGSQLKGLIEQLQELGCVVKDLDAGLVDFPTLFRGEEVYLCWKLGETDIEFWHGVDEGFQGRKAIDQDFRDHHRGDRAH